MTATGHLCLLCALAVAAAACDPSFLQGQWLMSSATQLNGNVASVISVSGATATCGKVTPTFGTCSWSGNANISTIDGETMVMQAAGMGTVTGHAANNCTSVRWANGDVWLKPDPSVANVHVVYMTHRTCERGGCMAV